MISKLIVEKFNGKIDFVSTFKKGSTFFFTFELEIISFHDYNQYIVKHSKKASGAKRSPTDKKSKNTKESKKNLFQKMNRNSSTDLPLSKKIDEYEEKYETAQKWKNERIMVVDDEEFCIAAMESMLKLLGINTTYHVDFCINGQEAVDQIIKGYKEGHKYKIIFSDFQMPIMDGIDATKKIRHALR